jgi:hypothetical protein
MQRFVSSRPSPAAVIAVVALVAALAGTAVASDPGATTSALGKKKVKKIARKQISKAAPGLSVAHAVGATALDELEYVRSNVVTVPSGADGTAHARCPAGTFVTGGGGTHPDADNVVVLRSYPSNGSQNAAGFTAWEYRVRNTSPDAGLARNIRAYAICARTDGATGNYRPGVPAL